MNRLPLLATTFVELADSLVEDFDVVDVMTLLTRRCVELFDATGAGLLLADAGGNLRVMAATDETVNAVDLFQIQNDEGPCRDCFHTGVAVDSGDLAADTDRWPRFAPVAVGGGIRAAHALPMRLRGDVIGALNLFRDAPISLGREDLVNAQALADVATIAVIQSRALHDAHLVRDQLQHALHSRIAIEQAKGIIAERCGCDPNEAFTSLRRHARVRGRRLTVVAEEVIDGTLRPEEIRRPSP